MSREKQIEEMVEELRDVGIVDWDGNPHNLSEKLWDDDLENIAIELYNAGYRKQSEGEWTRVEVNGKNYGQVYYQHKECKVNETQLFPSPYHFCPNCGAKMKGGAE